MTQARFELDSYSLRVLDVVKGKYGLKNRNAAFRKLIEKEGPRYVKPNIREEVLDELDLLHANHLKKKGFSAMSEEELDKLLGL